HNKHMLHIDIFTLVPEVFPAYFGTSIMQRAQEAGLLTISLHNIRDYAPGRHRVTDEAPYGGGGGMVLKPEPIFNAVEAVLGPEPRNTPLILLTPQGRLFTQAVAAELAGQQRFALLCGRYEGVDERVREHLVTDAL